MSARGLCECGCGQPTPIATQSDSRYGRVRGLPTRFLLGHSGRRPIETPPCSGDFRGACTACGEPLHPSRTARCQDGHYPHAGRNACTDCYRAYRIEGRLDELPRLTYTGDELLAEWTHLRGEVPFHLFHERVGLTQAGWERAFYRAQAAGDERAVRGADDQRWSA